MLTLSVSTTSKIPSGTANSIQVLMACQGLVQLGHQLDLTFPGQETPSFGEVRAHYDLHCEPFMLQALPSRRALRRLDFCISSLYRGATQIKPDVYYTWTLQLAALAASLPLGISNKPIVYEMHDLPTGTFGERWARRFVRANHPKRIVFITQALCDRFRERFPESKEEDCVIAPNGINLEEFEDLPDRMTAKQRLGLPLDRPIVSCTGHLYPGRGAPLFLELAAEFPEVLFYWFGGTDDAVAEWRALVAERNLTNVVFYGFVKKADVPMVQAASDIVVMPYEKTIAGSSGGNSAAICSPMKMFEYMAVGRPILSSALPVIREVLNESNAYFAEPESLASWRAALQRMLDEPEEAAKRTETAKRDVLEYTWKKRAEKILDALP